MTSRMEDSTDLSSRTSWRPIHEQATLPLSMISLHSRLRAAHPQNGQFAFEFFYAPLDVFEFVGAEGIIEYVQHGQDTVQSEAGFVSATAGWVIVPLKFELISTYIGNM